MANNIHKIAKLSHPSVSIAKYQKSLSASIVENTPRKEPEPE